MNKENINSKNLIECMMQVFEQLPQKYQMILFGVSLGGFIGLNVYAIHKEYYFVIKSNELTVSTKQ